MGCGSSTSKGGVHDPAGEGRRGRGPPELLHGGDRELEERTDVVLADTEKHSSAGKGGKKLTLDEADGEEVDLLMDGEASSPKAGNSASGNSSSASPASKKVRQRVVFTKGMGKEKRTSPSRKRTQKSDEEASVIIRAFEKCYLISDRSEEDKEELMNFMVPEKVKVGSNVVTAGKKADNFYVIESGTFEITTPSSGKGRNSGASSTIVRSGSGPEPFMGENALLFQGRAPSTIKCVGAANQDGSVSSSKKHGRLWHIDRQTFRHVITSRVLQTREEFLKAVESIDLLSSLTPEQREAIADAMEVVTVKANQRVVCKGDYGNVCYFIKEGHVECSNIGEQGLGKIELGPGSYFGERALLTDEPRAADVTTLEDTVLLALDRTAFNEILGPLRSLLDTKMKERVMEAVPILQQLPGGLRDKILPKFELLEFEDGEVVVHEGDIGDKFYIVRSGVVDVLSMEILSASEGRSTGAVSSRTDGTSVTAASSSAASQASDDLGDSVSSFSKGISRSRKSAKDHSNGISAKSHDPTEVYGMRIATLGEGEWFGEMALLNNEPRTATVMAVGPVECFVLSFDSFKLLRGKSELLMDTSKKRQEENQQKRQSQSANTFSQLSLKDLNKRTILGKGTFGTVYLVESSAKASVQGYWAMKMMNKAHIVDCDQTRNVANERNILKELSHPFILRLLRTFQDKSSLYMLLEFVQGGELFSIMQQHFRLPLSHAQFYAACIIDAFDYMHSLDIVYRDLKPENVLIDAEGYVKIADFGFAKKITNGKTFTLCGTPEYLAPEVVLGKGHNKGVDYWGVGILVYEILAGISPFADEYTDDQIVVCKNIVNGKIDYHRLEMAIRETEMSPPATLSAQQIKYVFSRKGKRSKERKGSTHTTLSSETRSSVNSRPVESLIRKLLTKSPNQRFGCLKDGALDIKKHAFFGIDANGWEELHNKMFSAPFVPQLSSPTDTSNFDEFEPDNKWTTYTGSNDWCKDF